MIGNFTRNNFCLKHFLKKFKFREIRAKKWFLGVWTPVKKKTPGEKRGSFNMLFRATFCIICSDKTYAVLPYFFFLFAYIRREILQVRIISMDKVRFFEIGILIFFSLECTRVQAFRHLRFNRFRWIVRTILNVISFFFFSRLSSNFSNLAFVSCNQNRKKF